MGPIALTPDVLEIIADLVDPVKQEPEVNPTIMDLFLDPVIGTVAIVSLIVIIAILVGLIFVVTRRQLNNQTTK